VLSPKVSRVLRQAAAYVIAAACLVWVFHDVDASRFLASVTGLDWGWVALAIVFDTLSYVCQGIRWRLLLEPLGRISSLRATEAVYSGLFVNEVLPFHLGEVARAYPVSRWLHAPFVAVIPSMALERLFDGIWLAAGIGITAVFVPLPRDLVRAGDIFGLAILALTALFLFLLFRKTRRARSGASDRAPRRGPAGWIARNLHALESGLRSIGLSRSSIAAFFLSFLVVLLQALSFWLIMAADGFRLSFLIGTAVFLIVRFGTVLPGAPGNLGLYQVFCVLGLSLFGVEKSAAAGFSVVVFVLLSVPLWALGFFALGRTGMTFAAIKSKMGEEGGSA